MISDSVKIVVFIPLDNVEQVLKAMHDLGAGIIGNYSHCSFSSKGTGRFFPEDDADPVIGSRGKLETVNEERVEVVCPKASLKDVLIAMKAAHPYEEVAYDVYQRLDE